MLTASQFRDLVSGRKRGWRAAMTRVLLRLAETPYTAVVQSRNLAYDLGWSPTHQVDATVVSVGNLTMGGTGKTPMVQWLADWFLQNERRVTLVSRGYKAGEGSVNDEALELAQRLPHVPHLQNPDRVAAARRAIAEHEAEIVLLDDAFQHRRIHRQLDIVLIDALEPTGYEHVFPRGTLREPLTNLKRADVVVLSRSDTMDEPQRTALREQLLRLAPKADWAEVVHQPQSLLAIGGPRRQLSSLTGQKVLAFCGIGNPAGFRHTLSGCGYDVVDFVEFPDHHRYDEEDLLRLGQIVKTHPDASAVICTCKDLVKIQAADLAGRPIMALEIGVAFRAGRQCLEERLTRLLQKVD